MVGISQLTLLSLFHRMPNVLILTGCSWYDSSVPGREGLASRQIGGIEVSFLLILSRGAAMACARCDTHSKGVRTLPQFNGTSILHHIVCSPCIVGPPAFVP